MKADPRRVLHQLAGILIASALLFASPARSAPFALSPGDVLVAEGKIYWNGYVARILKVGPSGFPVTVLASSQTSVLSDPYSICQDGNAALLIADAGATVDHGAILRLDLGTGAVTSLLSGYGLTGITGFSHIQGSDFITTLPEFSNGTIFRVSESGAIRTLVANSASGAAQAYRTIREPGGADILIGHTDEVIRRLEPGATTATAWIIDPRLKSLEDIKRLADGTLITASSYPGRVCRIAPDGTVTVVSEGGLLLYPTSVAVLPGGDILVGDGQHGTIVRVDASTGAQSYFLAPGSVVRPSGLTVVEASADPAMPATWGAIKAAYR